LKRTRILHPQGFLESTRVTLTLLSRRSNGVLITAIKEFHKASGHNLAGRMGIPKLCMRPRGESFEHSAFFLMDSEGEKGSDVFESVITRMGLVTKVFERKQERQIPLTPADYARKVECSRMEVEPKQIDLICDWDSNGVMSSESGD
jgi:hypothetical protein